MGTITKKKGSKKSKSSGRGTGQKHIVPTESTKKPVEFKSSLLKIATEVNSVGDEFSWDLRNKPSCNDSAQASEPGKFEAPGINKGDKKATDKPEKKRTAKSNTKKESAKDASKDSTPSSPAECDNKENGLDSLWEIAKASKAKKPKESQVWIDCELYRKIEMLNLKCGKPVPTKHVVNAILKLYLDGHKAEISKASK